MILQGECLNQAYSHFTSTTGHLVHTTSSRCTSSRALLAIIGKRQEEATEVVKGQKKQLYLHFQLILHSLTETLLCISNCPHSIIRFAQFFKEQTLELKMCFTLVYSCMWCLSSWKVHSPA